MNQAFICDAVRTPFGRFGGALATMRADDLAALPLKALLARNPGLDPSRIDDVIFGCANQAGEDNRNVARMALLLAGLPESVFATEGFAFLNDLLFSGILFCLLPTLYLVPKLYGKIEPLLGMQPRTKNTALDPIGWKAVLGCAVAFAVAIGAEFMAESGLSLIDWEADWAESSTAMAIGMVVAAVLAVAVALIMRARSEKSSAEKGV